MVQGNAIRACATHANPTYANAIQANAPPAEHHIIAETRRHCRSCREDICEKYARDTAKLVKLPREIVWITWLIVINLAKSKI